MSFPLIGDVHPAIGAVLRRIASKTKAWQRATFILDLEGWVVSVTANALEVDRSGPETLRLVQAFQAGGLTACERQPGNGVLVPA